MEKYQFTDDGLLAVQQVRKCELAFFYHRTPVTFRKEISTIFIKSAFKHYYSSNEVEKIFAHLGPVTVADVENARERIAEYYKMLRDRYKEKHLIR